MIKLLLWIKNTPVYVWIAGTLLSLLVIWGEIRNRQGKKEIEDKVKQEQQARESATRERGRKADEKINSSDTFITDWLRSNNRFRD
jgi:hypothetical protein